MTMKGRIKPDHIPQNKYVLRISGMPAIEFLKVTGLDEELETVDLPDRTKASGGQTKAGEAEVEHMLHHAVEVRAMEDWFKDSQDPVRPGYKKDGVLIMKSLTGLRARAYQIKGCFPKKRKPSDLEMKDEGNPVTLMWTLCWDQLKPM